MPKSRGPYPPEFRQRIGELVHKGRKAGQAAAAISMVTAGVEAGSWDPIQGHY